MICLSRINTLYKIFVYLCLGFFLFINLKAVISLDKLFEDKEYYYQTLVKGVTPYFKKDKSKVFVLFGYSSFADPILLSYYTSDLPAISAMFFDYKLISVTELDSLPNSEWIKDKYPTLPKIEDIAMLKFDGKMIQLVPPEEKVDYYSYFVDEARPLYRNE